jgi:signal transduction histidine kinase
MPSQPKSIQVLLLENDCADAKSVLNLLSQQQCGVADISVAWVTSLSAGLSELTEKHYDAVLLNLGLPDSDGVETLTKLREHSKSVPVVIMSGLDDKALALETVQKGAQDFLVKGRPSGESIFRSIQYSIERCRADRAVTQLKIVQEREHFIAMLAHNLSIPVIGAQRILSILIELGSLPDDACHLLSQIKNSNQTLLHTINNALDLYRYEAHHEEFVQTEVNVARLVADCIREVKAESVTKNIRLVKSFSPEDTLWADPLAMRKVLLNLLNNAVKFTPEGGQVKVSFRGVGGNAVLKVSDTGIGVEPDLVDLIFDRGYQKGRRYQADGFGIGLGLCKRFVEAQNGRIACRSQLNRGTTIEITLPQRSVATDSRSNLNTVQICHRDFVEAG